MRLLWQLALRNLFRKKKRTLLTLSLIACSVAAMMMMHGLIEGMKTSMISSATRLFPGDGQIHKEDYHLSRDENLMFSPHAVIKSLKVSKQVEVASERIYQNAMIASSRHATNVLLVGINPSTEAILSKVKQAVIAGTFLENNRDNSNEILLGAHLANELDVSLGDRVVLSAPQILLQSERADGVAAAQLAEQEQGTEIAQGLFRVSGIVQFNAQRMDKSWVFINIKRSQALLGTPDYVHEVAVNFYRDKASTYSLPHRFISHDSIELRLWPELLPELSSMLDMTDTSLFIMGLILFIIAALGIINTLFMSIYERMWEFAVIKAMGNTPGEVFLMILFEAILLGILGVLAGIALGSIGNIWLANVGIDYSNMEFSGAAIVEPIRPELHSIQYLHIPLVSLLLVLLSALYPARFASRIMPARALHKSL